MKKGNVVEIAFIQSNFPGRGNFRKMLSKIRERGFEVKVLQPSFQMQKILRKQGFKRSRKRCPCVGMYIYTDRVEYCTTWYIPKKRGTNNVKA
jgi:hypothetical protein